MRNRNELAKQYGPLVIKVANQIAGKCGANVEDCISAGNVGLVYAIDNYNENSSQSFTQYGAYMIRYFILNDLNDNAHTIRVNRDQQKVLQAKGMSVNLTTSLDAELPNTDGETNLQRYVKGDDESSVYMSVDPDEDTQWAVLINKLSKVFSERDMDIFCSTFGLQGRKELKGKDIAKKYGVSAAAVTQVRNKIIKFLRTDKEMKSILVDLMQLMNRENY